MAIVVDGTTIQDCAGVNCDATNITNVSADGSAVYVESCFSGIWSGSTWADNIPYGCPECGGLHYIPQAHGLETSGANSRYMITEADYYSGCAPCGTSYGGWVAANSAGVGNGVSHANNVCGSGLGGRINYGSTSFQMVGDLAGSCCTIGFNPDSGFSGETGYVAGGFTTKFFTSGFQLRAHVAIGCTGVSDDGEWVTLA